MDALTETPIPSAVEAGSEKKLLAQERAVKALKDGLSIFESDIPETSQTPSQKAELEETKRKISNLESGGDGTDVVELRDEKGTIIRTQKEGIPVYELIEYLNEKHKSLPRNSPQAKELRSIIRTLTQRSTTKDYLDSPYRWIPRYYQARVREEMDRLKTDGRTTGEDAKDEELAKDAISKRRELFIPRPNDYQPTPTPPTPPPPETSDPRITISFIAADDDAKKMAREGGAEYVREQLHVKNRWDPREWMRAIKFRLGEPYYKLINSQKIQVEQIRQGQYFVQQDAVTGAVREVNNGRQLYKKQLSSTAQRFSEGGLYTQEETQNLASTEISSQINNLITRYAKGELTNEQFETERQTVVELLKANPDVAQYIKDSNFIASDILEVAQKVKLSFERGQIALENLDRMLDVQVGRAIMAATTEADYSRMEKTMNWLQGGKYRSMLANPLFIGVAFGLAGVGARGILGISARVATGFPLAGALGGAVFAGLRRWTDLKRDLELQERDATYSKTALMDKRNAPRRSKLEEYRYNIAEGGGRVSAQDLLGKLTNLSNAENLTETQIDEILGQVAEIDARINYGIENKVDLMTFSDRFGTESEKLQLVLQKNIALGKIRAARQGQGKSDAEISREIEDKIKEQTGVFWSRFNETKEEQDKRFRRYRVIESLKAAGIGAATGLVGGALTQEVFAGAARLIPDSSNIPILGAFLKPGQTFAEKGLENFGLYVGPGSFSQEAVKTLFEHPGNIPINHDLILSVNSDHVASFLDAAGNKIPAPAMHLDDAGRIISSGTPDNLPSQIKDLVLGWEHQPNLDPNYNLHEKLRSLASSGQHATFMHGDTIIDINSGPNGQMSMKYGDIHVHGFLQPDGTLDIDKSFGGNANLTPNQLHTLQNALHQDGWDATLTHRDGGNILDQLLNLSPDQLRQQGIIETDQFKKSWNFHVLRPDIVSATGMHTHNELTLHVGMLGRAGRLGEEYIWGRPGQAGLLNFGGEIHGGEIQSHLYGVSPKLDAALNELMQRSGGLKLNNMMMVVDLTDGRQIMLQLDANGNAQLPDGLYDPNSGALRGIKTIAAAVLQGPDGKILQAQSILSSGQIPVGSVVHSLASERFPEIPIPPAPPIDIFHFTPPVATEFLPPVIEAPPFIPTPFAPRYPLESLEPEPGLPPSPYYSGESLASSREWLRQNPENHKPYIKIKNTEGKEIWVDKDGNPVVRNIDMEKAQIETFLNKLKSEDPDHYRQLQELLPQTTPMSPNTRVAVNIPAWMEGKTIYNTLQLYSNQTDQNGNPLDPSLYEINIIINRKIGEIPDESVEEIERYKADMARQGKNINVNYVDVEFPPPFNNVGNARRVITNLTLLRSLQRAKPKGVLYIESEDADLLNIDPRTVVNIIDKLDQNPHLDAVRGIQDRMPETMMQNDFLFLYRRMQDFKELLLRRKAYRPENNPAANFNWNRIITGGWNTAYTAEAYTLTGGYNPYQTKGEDMMMGERISMVRGNGITPNTEVIGKVPTRTDSSPRRYIYEVITGQAAYGDNFENPAVNEIIRNTPPNQLMNLITHLSRLDESNLEMFKAMLNNEYSFIKATTPNSAEARKVVRFALLWLGFKEKDYEITSHDYIEINNLTNVQQALNDYRARHQAPRQAGERAGYKNPNQVATSAGQTSTPASTPPATPTTPTPPRPPSPPPTPGPTETLAATAPVPIFVTSEEVQKAPGGLTEVVNQHLNDATQDRVRLETTPDNLIKYLQTLQIPNTTKVESPHARIENGRLIVTSKITGSVKVGVGPLSKNVEVSPNIEAILETDPITRKLRVSGYKLSGINRAQEMALRALAGKYINNLDGLMRENIDRDVDPNWEVTGFNIVGDKLAFDFRKLYMSVLV